MLVEGFYSVLGWIFLALTIFSGVALFFAAMAREDGYRAASKNTKQFWLIILGVAFAVMLLVPVIFLQIIAVIAVIVFMVDVRPALKQVGAYVRGGGRRGGSSSDGPYGPFNGR